LLLSLLLLPLPVQAEVTQQGLAGRLILGYQGWYGCPGDFQDNGDWQHWFWGGHAAQNLAVELLPSTRGIDPRDLCDSGLKRPDGSAVHLFSSQNARVVAQHFAWMRDHGIDGVAVQRFASELAHPERRRRLDHLLENVRAAAAASRRVFYVTYDITGGPPDVTDLIRRDWKHLVDDLKLTASPAYLTDHSKPVVEFWGFGFLGNHPGAPTEVASLIADFKAGRGGLQAAMVVGGVPTHWRTLIDDSRTDQAWAAVYRNYDVISPWSVGRFGDEAGADAFLRDDVLPDLAETRRLGVGYQPVVFPGFSWSNLQRNHGTKAPLNQIPRQCGRFLWHQVFNLLRAQVDMLYGAMFDELDEGTAMLPSVTSADKLPTGSTLVYLNEDGCRLPDDWYLRVIGKAAGFLRAQSAAPPKLESVLTP
jgi:hypothetical protein